MKLLFFKLTDGNDVAINPESVRYVVPLEDEKDPKGKTEIGFLHSFQNEIRQKERKNKNRNFFD